jgi:prepilin-type N-terminal cleavage/methylation domain-containing protein
MKGSATKPQAGDPHLHHDTRHHGARRAGFTLLELSIALSVFLLGVLGYVRTMVSLEHAQQRAKEAGRALQAARAILERIDAEAFPEAFRRYNTVAADDPGGVGTAPGANFAVEGLAARAGDIDGLPGQVVFATHPSQPGYLWEGLDDQRLGMPCFLNADGDQGDLLATDYQILPVLVRVEWTSSAGPGRVELATILGNW